MTTKTKRQIAADELATAFTTMTRIDGMVIVICKPDAPDWITDAVQEAHGGMMPDDMRYKMIRSLAADISEALAYNADADLSYEASEHCDSAVSCYHSDRFAWLASHNSRADYCDEAREEGMVADDATLSDRVAAGWYRECEEIWHSLAASVDARAWELVGGDEGESE